MRSLANLPDSEKSADGRGSGRVTDEDLVARFMPIEVM
jgi:hypothetical protein